MSKRRVRFQISVPRISRKSIGMARRMAAANVEGTDEHFLASMLLMLAEELETLNGDLAKAGGRFWREKWEGEP